MKKADRLQALNALADKLSGNTIYQKTVWLIMDKKRKVIAKGVPRNRYLCLVDDTKDRKRLLTYNSEGMAKNGFTNSGFYTGEGVQEYFIREYGMKGDVYSYTEYLEPVEAKLTVKI